MRTVLLVLPLFACLLPALGSEKAHQVVGAWEGESTCTVPDSPCHDEHVVYEIAPDPASKTGLKMDAFKIVKGEKEFMGTIFCAYTAPVLSCTANTRRNDQWTFTVEGDTMRGELRVDKERTLYRKVRVSRKPGGGHGGTT